MFVVQVQHWIAPSSLARCRSRVALFRLFHQQRDLQPHQHPSPLRAAHLRQVGSQEQRHHINRIPLPSGRDHHEQLQHTPVCFACRLVGTWFQPMEILSGLVMSGA